MNATLVWRSFIFAFALINAYSDLRWKKIPRGITVFGLVAGLAVNWQMGHALSSAVAALVGFGISLGFFSIGAIGGGDVKLVTALGAMLGLEHWAKAMEIAVLAAGVMALVQVIRHRAVRQTLHNMGEILRSIFQYGFQAHPVLNVKNDKLIRSPFAVAAAVGTLVAVISI